MFARCLLLSVMLIALAQCETTVTSLAPTNVTTKPTTTVTPKPTNVTTVTPKPTNVTTVTPKPANVTTVTPTPANVTTETPTPANVTTETPKPSPTTPVNPASHPALKYKVQADNKTCVMVNGQMQLIVPYNTTNGTASVKLGFQDSMATGSCAADDQFIIIKLNSKHLNTLTIKFGKNKDNFWWKEVSTFIVYDKDLFPGVNASMEGSNKTETFTTEAFKATLKGSYLCNADSTTQLNGTSLETWDLQYAAYQDNIDSFSTNNQSECSADATTSSIVPIAVGAALAGLVVIVLIAYLIGRRRNRKGYESV